MQCGIAVPNFGSTGNPRVLVELAVRAEWAGWDGFFVWDHLLGDPTWQVWTTDAITALAAVAQATSRVRIGPMVAAVPRRHPAVLARETVTLDHLSEGGLVVGVGLGWPSDADFGRFGLEADVRRRAEMLDEGLAVLDGLWSGEPFAFQGRHCRVDEVTFLPRPVQRPRIPVWVGSLRPGARAPLRRAARWDGFAPAAEDGALDPEVFAADVAEALQLRAAAGLAGEGFDVCASGMTSATDHAAAVAVVAPYAEAGATWWHEIVSDWLGGLDAIRCRIDAGPPRA